MASRLINLNPASSGSQIPTLHIGDIVKWRKSGDQLWILLFIQQPLHIIRTLPMEDGSFATRTIQNMEDLTIIQSGNIMKKDVTGLASVFSKNNLPLV